MGESRSFLRAIVRSETSTRNAHRIYTTVVLFNIGLTEFCICWLSIHFGCETAAQCLKVRASRAEKANHLGNYGDIN